MPKVSIIMPVYNVEPYLPTCLNSVLGQTFSDFELLCIDDCSTDGSLRILEEYSKKDPRIRVLQNAENLRAAGTRNVGLENATGDYIYFIDADDYLDPGYLQELYEMSLKTGADIVTNTNIITQTNGVSKPYIHTSMPELPAGGGFISNEVAAERAFCVVWMRLFKRSLLEEHHIRFQRVNMTEDNVFHFVTSIHAAGIFAFLGTQAYHYVIRDDSVTGIVKQNNQRDLVTMKATDIIYDYLAEHGLLESNKVKLFTTNAFYKVDTEEKFQLYKSYFQKVSGYVEQHKEMFTEADLFFAESILSSESLPDYLRRYPSSVALAFLKNRKKR